MGKGEREEGGGKMRADGGGKIEGSVERRQGERRKEAGESGEEEGKRRVELVKER